MFNPEFLFFGPVMMLGAFPLVFICIILGLLRNGKRLIVTLLFAVAGYLLLGTEFALALAESARESGGCPDAAYLGPPLGVVVGAVVGIIVYELW